MQLTNKADILKALSDSRNVVVLIGSGLSNHSGILTYRGENGLWSIYNQQSSSDFVKDPQKAWEEFLLRTESMRMNEPNIDMYEKLYSYLLTRDRAYIITTNIDGHIKQCMSRSRHRKIYHKVLQLHGSIKRIQCTNLMCDYTDDCYELESYECPWCSSPLRPNVLFFEDESFDPLKLIAQLDRYENWLVNVGYESILGIEIGCGNVNQELRMRAEEFGSYIRVNIEDGFDTNVDALRFIEEYLYPIYMNGRLKGLV